MYKKRSTDTPYTSYTPAHRRHWFFRMMVVIGFVCLIITGTTFGTTKTTYASGPGGNVADPVVRAVDIAEPAVVRIFTTLGGHLAVHFSDTSIVTFPQGTGNSYALQLSGSGTFITSHGDILTADHVINPPHDQSLSSGLDDLAAKDVAAYINLNAKPGSQVTTDQVDQQLKSGQLASSPTYDPASSQVFLNTAYTGPLDAQDFSSIPFQLHAAVDRIEKESSFSDKDVAIIHVNMNDIPSVQLGDSANVQQQDGLTIIGFPGNGDVSSRPTDLLTTSVNKITVSSIKTTDAGAQVIQVSGNVEHGDSGGPALDSSGAVVGIVSFGLSSPNSPGSTTFLQASNSARALVQSLNLDTTPGAFQKAWSQAFADYAANTPGHWHKAEQELQKIATNYPLFKAVTPYLNYALAQAKTERSPQSSPTPISSSSSSQNTIAAYAMTIGGIVIILLLIVLLVAVAVRQRRGGKKSSKPIAPAMDKASQGPRPSAIPQAGAKPAGASVQRQQASPQDDGMAAFGAPSARPAPPVQSSPAGPPSTVVSGTLRPWPCGHMNRPGVNYCSICGEPAPPPTRRGE